MKPCTLHPSLENLKKLTPGNFFILHETETLKGETKNPALKKFIVPYDVFAILHNILNI